mgnify:CR=1 FL=1
MKHQYKVIDIDEVGMNEEMYINMLGSQGWELVNINNEPADRFPLLFVKLYFKRPLKEQISEPITYI